MCVCACVEVVKASKKGVHHVLNVKTCSFFVVNRESEEVRLLESKLTFGICDNNNKLHDMHFWKPE